MSTMQSQIERIGQEIFRRVSTRTPRAYSPKSVTGRLLDWSMRDEQLKARLFRAVDVLPALGSSAEVASHVLEYLDVTDEDLDVLSFPGKWAVRAAPQFPWASAVAVRAAVRRMARNFILAETPTKALPKLRKMRAQGLESTVDLLGEVAVSERESGEYAARYLELIDTLAAEMGRWKKATEPNVSVKISALFSRIHPEDPEGAIESLSARLHPLLHRANECGVFVNFDMEMYRLKDLTLALFRHLLDEPEFRRVNRVGLAMQAYLRDTSDDLSEMISWSRARDRRITVRLVKGAYWDTEQILARQRGWPIPVFERKTETDANFERLAKRMLENSDVIECAFGTHNIRSIAACIAEAERLGRPRESFEFQLLFGMAEPVKEALVEMGCRVRNYCPVGAVIPGMSYLVRRLLENSSNEGFLRSAFSEHESPEALLRDPAAADHSGTLSRAPQSAETGAPPLDASTPGAPPTPAVKSIPAAAPKGQDISARGNAPGITEKEEICPEGAKYKLHFANEPMTDFTRAEAREAMRNALEFIRQNLGHNFPLFIGGQERTTSRWLESRNPARPGELIGCVAEAGPSDVEDAVAAAERAFPAWRDTPVEERARVIEKAGQLLHERRFKLAALEVLEVGKTWAESDADVCEAIDFCRYYAREMRRIASRELQFPGEASLHHYIPRGIAAVIAPWNFPLAILCGMTTAALVTGNCVLMKPAEQSPMIAYRLMRILAEAGVPPGVLAFLPGPGNTVGDRLVRHPAVSVIAFTGSRKVGLKIQEIAGRTPHEQRQLKKVICEMGGKNAIIVDEDADPDVAIPAILASAYGYQGQKCSALSRLIVLPRNGERIVDRLIDAAQSLRIGDPADPSTDIGPLIDEAALEKVRGYIATGRLEATLAFQAASPQGYGFFVGPVIFTGVQPNDRIAQEEIFGPVLAVIRATDLEDALRIANGTPYALTGGLLSRSPANIERVKRAFRVGNLYINRGITGALVARHPFGGFDMSGGGTKAGGPDYLLNFLYPRAVTENVIRCGFAPE